MPMQRTIELTTPRIKSICFHPSKSILLAALHSSEIYSIDYMIGTIVYKFKDHEGPVRCVKFHPKVELFGSAGDDCVLRIWDYKSKMIFSKFKGHKDYIRCIDFHSTKPWILSSSDDQTLRIWNFQSKKLVCVLSGHTNYVMSCKFFGDKMVSGSLDESMRIWDLERLLKDNNGSKHKNLGNILGIADVPSDIVDAHEKALNSVDVCENRDGFVIVSGSDDRSIKIWSYEHILRHLNTLYHHQRNVSAVRVVGNILYSCGEDGILAFYDLKTKKFQKYQIEERFWSLDVKDNLVAAGHDKGLIIFSTKNIHPVYSYDKYLLYLKDCQILKNDFKSEVVIRNVKEEWISILQNEDYFVLNLENSYQIFKKCIKSNHKNKKNCINDEKRSRISDDESDYSDEKLIKREEHDNDDIKLLVEGHGNAYLFEDFYVVKNKTKLLFKKYNKEKIREKEINGKIIPINKNEYGIFESKNLKIYNEFNETFNFFISHDVQKIIKDGNEIFIIGNFNVTVVELKNNSEDLNENIKRLNINNQHENYTKITTFQETTRINSAIFKDFLLYSTTKHLKYYFNGERGIIQSLNNSYILDLIGNQLYIFDNEPLIIEIDLIELNFKKRVLEFKNIELNKSDQNKEIKDALRDIPGLSMLNFLIKNGKAGVALPYIKDKNQKFEILLSENRLKEALLLNKNELKNENTLSNINKIYKKSIEIGDENIMESCLKILKNEYKLFLLSVCTKKDMKFKSNFEVLKCILNDDSKRIREILEKQNEFGDFNNENEDSDNFQDEFNISDMETIDGNKNYEENDMNYDKNESENINKSNKTSDENDNNIEEYDKNMSENVNKSNETSDENGNNIEEYDKNESDADYVAENINKSNETSDENDNNIEEYDKNMSNADDVDENPIKYIQHNKLEKYSEFIMKNINEDELFEESMKEITDGKFKMALKNLKILLYSTSDIKIIRKVSMYLSWLIVEKIRLKSDIENRNILGNYPLELELDENHKKLYVRNFMIFCYKNKNYDQAKELAKNIIDNNTDSFGDDFDKQIQKIIKSRKTGNLYDVPTGKLCLDIMEYREEAYKCKLCHIYNSGNGYCGCCGVCNEYEGF